jgi:hypothetical protein
MPDGYRTSQKQITYTLECPINMCVRYDEGLLYFYHLIYSSQSPFAMASNTPTTCRPLCQTLKKDGVGF